MAKARKADKEKIAKILLERGYKGGIAPTGYDAHHVIPLEEGGKDTSGNIRVIPRKKHQQIHANRKKIGQI